MFAPNTDFHSALQQASAIATCNANLRSYAAFRPRFPSCSLTLPKCSGPTTP